MASVFDRLASASLEVLAGPILRRAEPHRVCVWIAANRAFRVVGEIFPTEGISRELGVVGVLPDAIGCSEETRSIKLGAHLHVALAQITPGQDPQSLKSATTLFPTDAVLAYDLILFDDSPAAANTPGKRLKDLRLIDGPNAVNYEGAALPTFFLRGRRPQFNLLHGSCRKLHGPEEDCLALADDVIGKNVADLSARPSVLFLTGDQIYADDVAAPLIQHLTRLGNELLKWGDEETVPGLPKPSTIGVFQRQKLIEQPGKVKFTSGHGHNHLLTFGEFVAMYLVAWNGQNWPETYPAPRPIQVSETEPTRFREAQEGLAQYKKHTENLELARRTMPAVRRALANIPSYMLFDDHEVTDDWNITEDWCTAVKESPAGRRVVANGLAAFSIFQAWGNDPEMFAPRSSATAYFANKGQNAKNFEDDFWANGGWTFVAPTDPPTVFIDTRTQRKYDTGNGPARLLNPAGLKLLKERSPKTNGRPLLIVSPAPVYGFGLIENLQQALFGVSGKAHTFDLEAWRANYSGFMDFMKVLIQDLAPRCCILLSGDVHYAFSISALFTYKGRTMPLTQLTSSALKNTGWGNKWLVGWALEPISGRTDQIMGWEARTLVSGKLHRLLASVVAGNLTELEERNALDEIEKIKLEIHGWRVLLKAERAKELEISTPADWTENITYLGDPLSELPIVGENNLGLVMLKRNETRLEHVLLLKQKDKPMKRIGVAIDIAPLPLPAQAAQP